MSTTGAPGAAENRIPRLTQGDPPRSLRTPLEHALAYRKAGWSVVPLHSIVKGRCTCPKGKDCPSPGKHPRIAAWGAYQVEPPTEDEIREWWTRWPNANVGVITGAVSGIIALDIDGEEGLETLRQHGYHLPPTAVSRTGRGWHYVYKHPGGDCRNFAGKAGKTILPHVDFRGDGGLIVVQPSRHRSGTTYWWELTPEEAGIADPPDWLVQLIRRQASEHSEDVHRRLTAADWSVDIPEGARNVQLTRRAGSLLAGGKMEPAEALTMLLAWNERHCKPPLPEAEVRAIVASIAKAEASKKGRRKHTETRSPEGSDDADSPQGLRTVASPGEPMVNARAFVAERYTQEGIRTLHFHQDSFWAWDGTAYQEIEVARIRAELYEWLDDGFYLDDGGNPVPFNPNRGKVDNVVDALKAVTHLPASVQAPAWLGDEAPPYPAGEIIACRNGLLHVQTRTLLPHTPRFFNTFALPFDYDPEAPEPVEWLGFLRQLWEEDEESIQTLQEAMGYTLTADTSQQKMFLIVGPPRSGKGTIARVWRGLLGHGNVAGPTLSAFGTNFGLAPLIGKPLAIISDARLSGKADQQAVVERLLSISGEDAITIDRKYKTHWTGQLPTRIVILTNELPRLADTSGALANRFIVLRLTRSWLGKEDPTLTARLLRELPSILNWALEGLARLRGRGYFIQPTSSADVARELMELSSPITAFVREMCIVGPAYRVPADDLYEAWRAWCEANGRENPGTKQSFGRDLHAALPNLRVVRPREDGQQRRWYEGIGLLRRDETRLSPLYAGARKDGLPDPHAGNGQVKSTENNGVSRVSSRLTPDPPPSPVDGEVRQAGPDWRPRLGESEPSAWRDGRCVRCDGTRWRWAASSGRWRCVNCQPLAEVAAADAWQTLEGDAP